MSALAYPLKASVQGAKIIQLDLPTGTVTELYTFKKPYPSDCLVLSRHNRMYYFTQNQIVVAHTRENTITHKEPVPYQGLPPDIFIASPRQKYVACIGKQQPSGLYRSLAIFDTALNESGEVIVPEVCSSGLESVCFISETAMLALGRRVVTQFIPDMLYTITLEGRSDTIS